ncbi:MAG: hypothetical protein M3461_17060 [Pseudomonadota bacterium]|nr:hypothetical protein [Pseudomonadota bacterium]
MPEQTYDKKCIALAQIETALRLYFEGQDYFSVVTLAGAAEEILGKLLSAKGVDNSLDSLKKAVCAIHQKLFGRPLAPKDVRIRANVARNNFKHHDVGSAPTITLDLREEAIDMLQRAIDNYWLLEQWLTPAMEQFQREAMAA